MAHEILDLRREIMNGFFNRLLRIDLSQESFCYETIPDDVLSRTLGGKGLGIALLLKENHPGVDPLSPDNRFIFTTGPATGTKMWSQSRFGAFSKSPATGGFGESYCGGTLAPQLKGCGIDAVILEGKCESLTFLTVDESGVSFHDAAPLKGKDTAEAEDFILGHSLPGARAMTIGPAGENLVRFACIKSDTWRSLGRCGLGAVLGSKNIKGLSFCGNKKTKIADEDLLHECIKRIARKGKESPVTALYRKYGTPMQVAITNVQNCFPTRYWQSGHFPKWENLSADYLIEHFEVVNHPCPNCFLQCTKRSTVKHGRHQGLELEGPEYETIYALGGLNELDSLEEVAYLNVLCDKLGLDTMSAGNVAGFAVEAFKRGKIHFAIDYNEPDRMAELFRQIAAKEGVGALLAQGIKQASKELGLEHVAIHVKGLEPAGFDPRVLKGMALSYATSARGACHLRGTFYKAELSGLVDRDMIQGKARHHIDYEDRAALFDCLILCRFFRDIILWEELGDIIKATTGVSYSRSELEFLANSITQQTRAFNHREGMTSADDRLPERLLREKTMEGASLSHVELDLMIKEYNAIREGRMLNSSQG
jgi:aldehyde:ferredoxin oxidoreductase